MDKVRKTGPLVSEEIERPPLARSVRVDELKEGEERLIEVNQAERTAIAALLDLVALDRLSLACHFHRRGEGRLALRGTLAASVTQTCVVSLEPVASTLEVPIEIEFWPRSQIEAFMESADEATLLGMLDWPEPIVEKRIDLGSVVYETFATALGPYPKREGASLASAGAGPEAEAEKKPEGPFAALARLKGP